jgi:hypothetical protein
MNIIVDDNFQTKVMENFSDVNQCSLIADVILYGLIAFTYYYGDNVLHTRLAKYVFFVLFLRYFLDFVTSYKDENGKKEFQLNSHIAIFSLILILSVNLELNVYTLWSLLVSYTLFVSSIGYGRTVNNFLTLFTVYTLVQYKLV